MKRVLILVGLLMAAPLPAHAQSFRVYAIGGKSLATWHGQADVESFAFELERPFSKHNELGFVLAPYHLQQPVSWFGDQFGDGNEQVNAVSAALVLRHHFRVDSNRVRPYVELANGPMWAERRVPASTSRFNFVTQGGAGFTFLPERPLSLIVGYRFMHISNGGYAPRNPGLNVNSLVLGVRVRR
jgi:hypothetical protein